MKLKGTMSGIPRKTMYSERERLLVFNDGQTKKMLELSKKSTHLQQTQKTRDGSVLLVL